MGPAQFFQHSQHGDFPAHLFPLHFTSPATEEQLSINPTSFPLQISLHSLSLPCFPSPQLLHSLATSPLATSSQGAPDFLAVHFPSTQHFSSRWLKMHLKLSILRSSLFQLFSEISNLSFPCWGKPDGETSRPEVLARCLCWGLSSR